MMKYSQESSPAIDQSEIASPAPGVTLWTGMIRSIRRVFYWVRSRLFRTPADMLLTLVIGWLLFQFVPASISWLVIDAVGFWGDGGLCGEAEGACWPFLREKARLILFGAYPFDEQWRPALASLILMGLVGSSMVLAWRSRWLLLAWVIGVSSFIVLMQGGVVGLSEVQSTQWNGLPILLMLSVFSVIGAFPLGILLALARYQRDYPVISSIAVSYIELVRGVPMIMVLFMGLFILPLMLPAGIYLDPLYTTLTALVFFHAAYFAEAIRGGLQSVDKGQTEAADSQGFTYWQKIRLVILPQALKKSMPGIMNTLLGAYKDTSLVVILGIHDIMATAKMAYSDPSWQQYGLEAYFLVAIWYFSTCWCLSSYSRWLERRSA